MVGSTESLSELTQGFREPAASVCVPALPPVKAREAGHATQLPGLALLLFRDLDRSMEVSLRRLRVRAMGKCKLSLEPEQLSFMTAVVAFFRNGERLVQRGVGIRRPT